MLPKGPPLPGWTKRVDPPLLRAFRSVRLLGSVTPENAADERVRLTELSARGDSALPCWRYARRDMRETAELLAAIAAFLSSEAGSPLRDAYVARVEELRLEVALVETIGTETFSRLAGLRFPATACSEATPLAHRWANEAKEDEDGETILSDSPDPRSLLSRMRAACGERRLPFRVSAHPSLVALAATGEETIVIASGRELTLHEIARTVVHELRGHAEPRTRARSFEFALPQVGTASGADDQEGLALVFEREAGLLSSTRRRQLGARHLAVQWMEDGADFAEVAARLMKNHALPAHKAVSLAERAFRGGDGRLRGLGRDAVYLRSLGRVERMFAAGGKELLEAGQVGAEWAAAIAPYVTGHGPPSPGAASPKMAASNANPPSGSGNEPASGICTGGK